MLISSQTIFMRQQNQLRSYVWSTVLWSWKRRKQNLCIEYIVYSIYWIYWVFFTKNIFILNLSYSVRLWTLLEANLFASLYSLNDVLLLGWCNFFWGFPPQSFACAFLWAKLGFKIFFLQIYRPIYVDSQLPSLISLFIFVWSISETAVESLYIGGLILCRPSAQPKLAADHVSLWISSPTWANWHMK